MWGRNSVLSLSFLPQLINRKALSSPLSIYSFLPHEHHNSLYLIISSHSDFSGFWADAVIHHLVPPFRTEVLLLQLPRAVGSWQPRAEFPARTCTWLKELPHPGSQTFPEDSLYLVTGQCGGTKTWPPFFISRPLWRVMSDSELHSPPILNTAPPPNQPRPLWQLYHTSTASPAQSCFLTFLQVLFQVWNSTNPCLQIPISGPFQDLFFRVLGLSNLKQIHSFSLQLVMKVWSHLVFFHHVVLSMNKCLLIAWWYRTCKNQNNKKPPNIYDFNDLGFPFFSEFSCRDS